MKSSGTLSCPKSVRYLMSDVSEKNSRSGALVAMAWIVGDANFKPSGEHLCIMTCSRLSEQRWEFIFMSMGIEDSGFLSIMGAKLNMMLMPHWQLSGG
jgi:hypothetical protein